jgi:hypothetical protein
MATDFPSAVDSFKRPNTRDSGVYLANLEEFDLVGDLMDAVEAVETQVINTGALSEGDIVESGASTGVHEGGVLSVGSGSTDFSISDGTGVIARGTTLTSVSWTGLTDIVVTNILTHLITFVSINSSGTVVQQTSSWTATEARTNILLGVVVHVNKTSVDTVNNEQAPAYNVGAQLRDLMSALGFINKSGNVVGASGADLTVDKSDGYMIGPGVNFDNDADDPHVLNLPALTNASFQYRFQDGSNGATGTVIDPDIYDVAGTSTSVPTNKFTVQRFYSFTSNNLKVQPGQEVFNSLADAEASVPGSSFVTEPSIAANGLLRGFLCVQEGTTDLTLAAGATFYAADKHGESRI